MRVFSKNLLTISLAAVCVASLGVRPSAQEAEGKARIGNTEGEARIDVSQDSDTDGGQETRGLKGGVTSAVTDAHKASQIIGMEVKNHRGEMLGEIQDLVVDLRTGRISYAVLSSGGFLGFREKYIAIPATALSPAVDDKGMLVMNAEKSSIERTQGFAKNNWPALDTTAWGAGLNGELRTQSDERVLTESERVDRERIRGSANVQQRDRFDTEKQSIPGTSYDRNGSKEDSVFRGRVIAINLEKRTITVEGESGSETFELVDRPVLALKENRNPSLSDLKVGHAVAIGYHMEGDSHVAHSIIRTDPSEVK